MPACTLAGRTHPWVRSRLCVWLWAILVASVPAAAGGLPRADPDYRAIYNQGIGFADFLEQARARRDEWRERYTMASLPDGLSARMRALPGRRQILVVAEDWCGDSAQTIPYVARLAESAPDRLALRVVSSTAGRPVMDAHLTPDGRGATPTVIVLDEHGRVMGAWVERPSTTQRWFLEQQKSTMQQPLHAQLAKWYEEDGGRTALAEIAAILER